jgi:hypothetical protein
VVKGRRPWLAVLAVLGAAAVWLFYAREEPPAAVATPGARGRSAAGPPQIARIDLSRLEAPRREARVGRRNLFGFDSKPGAGDEGEAEDGEALVFEEAPPVTVPVSPPPPPLNVKYIGNLENPQGLKVAVLLTDRSEVLWGQVGEVVANRFRIVKIGLESVDIQETGSDRIRRIPLRGN